MSAHPSAATQTTIHFSLSEQGHHAISKGRELTGASGTGTLTLAERPLENAMYKSIGATGTITFHRWRVVAHRVSDEDTVTMNVVSGTYRFTKTTSTAVVQVTVTKTDPRETDNCPVGAAGELGLLDGRAGQPDGLGVNRLCGQHDIDYGGVKGRRATVAITVKKATP